MSPNSAIPAEALLFEPVEDSYGTRLALVFGSEARGGRCPFYERQCYHCDIGAGEGAQFDTAVNCQRLDFFRQHYAPVLSRVAHLVIYNSGSVLNQREFSSSTLRSILEWSATLPQCRVVSLDSREAFVTKAALDTVLQHLRPDQKPRPILGLETQDDRVRLELLNKSMTRDTVEKAFQIVGQYRGRVGLDINIVFGLPPFQGAPAVVEAGATARFALKLAARYDVPLDFNLHPYYPSRLSRKHFPDHPRADLAAAQDAVAHIQEVIRQSGRRSSLFVGLHDEAHDQEPPARQADLARYRQWFRRWNATQW